MSDLLVVTCVSVVAAIISCICIAILLYVLTPKSTIPGPVSLPIVGNLLELRKAKLGQHYEFYLQLAKRYGDIYRLFMGRQMVIRLNTPEIIHEAFVEKADVFSGRTDFLLNDEKGLVCSCGDDYRYLRRTLMEKMMNFKALVSDKRIFEEIYLTEVQHLKEHINMTLEAPMEITKLLIAANLNIILDMLFGFRYNYDDGTLMELVNAHVTFSKDQPPVSKLALLFPFLKPALVKLEKTTPQKFLFSYTEKEIKECRNTFDESNIRGLFDMFIQAEKNGELCGGAFSENNMLCALYDLLISAGNIGVLLSWCIVYMVRYPEIQQKCQDEIRKVVGSSRPVGLSDRERLNYVQATLTEIGRQSPVVPIIVPHSATADGTLRGHFVPKGTILIGDILAANFKDTGRDDTLNPEKHLTNNGEFKPVENDLTFGIGPRRCVGELMAKNVSFLVFTNLLQHFSIDKSTDTDDFDFKGHFGFIVTAPSYRVNIETI